MLDAALHSRSIKSSANVRVFTLHPSRRAHERCDRRAETSSAVGTLRVAPPGFNRNGLPEDWILLITAMYGSAPSAN
jgi:hypothetical protein